MGDGGNLRVEVGDRVPGAAPGCRDAGIGMRRVATESQDATAEQASPS
jgi:hypothetical protein